MHNANYKQAEKQTKSSEQYHLLETNAMNRKKSRSTKKLEKILEQAISEGEQIHYTSFFSTFLSSMSTGLLLGLSVVCISFAYSATPAEWGVFSKKLAMAVLYPLGFIISIKSGTALFTEQTALAVYPVLDKRVPIQSLFKIWTVVLMGNLLGTILTAQLLKTNAYATMTEMSYIEIAHNLLRSNNLQIFLGAIIAGWLMGVGGWLMLSTKSQLSQIIYLYIVTFIIGIGGFHHSIIGSAELFTAASLDHTFTSAEVSTYLLISIIGNLIGGSTIVAIFNYAQIKPSAASENNIKILIQ